MCFENCIKTEREIVWRETDHVISKTRCRLIFKFEGFFSYTVARYIFSKQVFGLVLMRVAEAESRVS